MSRYILNEVETSHHLILIRLYFILTILNRIIQFTCNAVNAHLNHRRIFLFSTPCGVGSLLCMRNINCKPHWLAICCLSRIFYWYILNEVETSHHLILIRLYFILTILITEDDHNHIAFEFLFSTPCGVGSLLCMRNINCKPHWLAICCLSRIFFFLDRQPC
jgi:hypothetical protein